MADEETKDCTLGIEQLRGVCNTVQELYDLMVYELEYHLPPREYTDVYWLAGIWHGHLLVS